MPSPRSTFSKDLELLASDAFLLLDHAERILADPALACARVWAKILMRRSDLPLLGSYLRWWLTSEEGWLLHDTQPSAWAALLPVWREPSEDFAECWIASPSGAGRRRLCYSCDPNDDPWSLDTFPDRSAPSPDRGFFMNDFWKIDQAMRSAHPGARPLTLAQAVAAVKSWDAPLQPGAAGWRRASDILERQCRGYAAEIRGFPDRIAPLALRCLAHGLEAPARRAGDFMALCDLLLEPPGPGGKATVRYARMRMHKRLMLDARRRFRSLGAELAAAPVYAQALAASERLEAERQRWQKACRRESDALRRSRRPDDEKESAWNLLHMKWRERKRQGRDEELRILGLIDDPLGHDDPLTYQELRAALKSLREESLVPEPAGSCGGSAS
ncbi:MAG: hypothetical protein HUK26_06910 [Duodenibacillus sp.]|nr:hypothetical protein [Duodenibacillus sp.]